MSRSPRGCGLLALLVIGSQAANQIIQRNGNDNGCNGVPHGIPCCQDGFVVGDNGGSKEMFIQPYEYISSCSHTCKVLHKDSVGITESVRQQYSSGQGKNKNKCWCEFGEHKLNSNNQEYRTCLFKSMSAESLPSDVAISSEAHETPEFFLVSSKGEAASTQREKMGLYKKVESMFHNNFPIWKNEKEEQYLLMSDHHHWAIGPHNNTDLFGILNYEDNPTPALPHLGKDWMFWDGNEWREDDLIEVLEGDTEDEGVDREFIFLEHSPLIIENVDDASQCCQVCKEQADPNRKQHFEWDHTKVFNYNRGAKTCDCMDLLDSVHWPITAVFTRYNPHFTSGLCDTEAGYELQRRSGKNGVSGYGTKRYYNKDTYDYTDVHGPVGEGRKFSRVNLNWDYGHRALIREDALDHNSCCRECQKINPKIQLEHHDSSYCHCYEVETGTRPVTIPSHDETFAGICNTTTTPNHVELIGGNSTSEGNVYVVNSQGKLGAICANPGLSEDFAKVVCRQLGFDGDDVVALSGSYFGPVNDDFAMSEVECNGNEARIQDCYYNSQVHRIPFNNEKLRNCGWGESAGVKCN